ncbi:MAG: hypothetical protein WD577_05580 [Bacteroidales bacterium]
MKAIYIYFIVVCCIGSANNLYCQQYGLYFESFDAKINKRTSLELFPDKAERIKEDFELSFDISAHENKQFRYGYVFRMIFNDNQNIDLIYGTRTGGQNDFSIIMGTRQSDIGFNINPTYLQTNWINFSVKFLLSKNQIIFSEGDTVYIDRNLDLQNPSTVKIYFGLCHEKNFESTDVPPIQIRDLKIHKKSELAYHWPLDEVEGNIATDIIRRKKASITNPIWLRRSHIQWEKIKDVSFSGCLQVTSNQEKEQVYMIGKDRLIVYQVSKNEFDTVYYSSTPNFLNSPYQAVFDPDKEVIISYNPDTKQRFFIDPNSGDITQEELIPTRRLDYWHHNKYFDPGTKNLYILNGYGHYLYKNKLLRCHIQDNTWEEISCDGTIPAPRYLAASSVLNDTIFVLGGYGSNTGSQRLNPSYYYDFYALSLKDLKFEEIRTYDDLEERFCFANSLVIDSSTRNFYALSFPKFKYNSYLNLVKGSLDNKQFIKLGDSIPYLFNDIDSYADLFYFPEAKKLLTVTTLSENNKNSKGTIYTIDYPPIEKGPSVTHSKIFWLFPVAGILLLLFLIAWRIRASRKKSNQTDEEEPLLAIKDVIRMKDEGSKTTTNSIYFFGGFQVFNRDGVDITKRFTRLLKELFLLIFLNSLRNERGISSEKIIEFLWFDKSAKSGRNNLSVNIAKLKTILNDLDSADLSQNTGYWKISINYNIIYSDYYLARQILKSGNISKLFLERLIDITSNGTFLGNVEYEWLDSYKAKISDKIVDTLISYSKNLDEKKDAELIISLADSVFNFDIANEEAMVLKCRTQYLRGNYSLAKNVYEAFCSEFRLLYNENYGKSFNDIIKQDNLP